MKINTTYYLVSVIMTDYSNKTLKELITLCKEKGIKGYSTKKKAELELLLIVPVSTVVVITAVTK